MVIKKIIIYLNLMFILLTTNSYAKVDITSRVAVEWWCSGILFRTVGIINNNINRFGGDARSTLTTLSKHLDNNGMVLMQKASLGKMNAKNSAERVNAGKDWANDNVRNNILDILNKGSRTNKIIMSCLSLNNK